MTDFSKVFWGFVFSVIGIALGWTLNQLSQWFRTRQEDKKNLKIVLYNLLETHFIFIRSDLDKYIQKVTDKVHSKMPLQEQTEEKKVLLKRLYTDISTKFIKPELSNKIKSTQESYQNAVKILATIDPFAAYYLSRRKNIIEAFDLFQDMFDNIKDQFPSEEHNEIQQSANQIVNIIKPEILENTLIDLENDIKKIAWKINPYVWFKAKQAIKKIKANTAKLFDTEIDELYNKITQSSRL